MPYVATRLGRWYYEERGSEQTGTSAIVLCHSLLFDGSQWEPQIRALQQLGRVVNIDAPGHGKSEVPPPFSLDDHTRAFVDALDALGIERASVVGLSWGGMIAMRLAIGYPMRVRAMALLDTSATPVSLGERAKYRALTMFYRRFGIPRPLFEQAIVPLFFTERTRREQPELIDRWYHGLVGFPRDGVVRAAKAVMLKRGDISGELRSISAPTLVMCGRQDRATRMTESELIAARVPRATLKIIDDAAHMCSLEHPAQVNDELVQFLTAQHAS